MSGVNRLLVVGLALEGTGFTRVLTGLTEALAGGWEVHFLGFARPEAPLARVPGIVYRPWALGARDLATADHLEDTVRLLRPAAVLVLGPVPWVMPILEALQPHRGRTRVLLYLPTEGRPAGPRLLDPLRLVDACVLYTEFARRGIAALAAAWGVAPPPLHVLPHGVDTAAFHPSPAPDGGDYAAARGAARRALFGAGSPVADAFVVLNANHPGHRKRVDLTIQGFARFVRRGEPNAYLYLHCVRIDRGRADQLVGWAKEAGVADRLLLDVLNPHGEPLPDGRLNALYNACDVGINTAMGEGWGLVSFEHAATGGAQVVPAHSTFAETWAGAAEMVPIARAEPLPSEHAEGYVVCADGVAAALGRLHDDVEHRNRMSHAAFLRATDPALSWAGVAERLGGILRETLAASPARRPRARTRDPFAWG